MKKWAPRDKRKEGSIAEQESSNSEQTGGKSKQRLGSRSKAERVTRGEEWAV